MHAEIPIALAILLILFVLALISAMILLRYLIHIDAQQQRLDQKASTPAQQPHLKSQT